MEYFLLPNWKKTTICRHQQTNCTLPLHLFSTNQPKRSTRATGARLTKCTQPFCGGWPKKVNKIKGARVGKYDCNRWTVFDKTRLIYFSIINFKSNLNSLSKLFIHFGFNLKSQRGNRCKFIRNFFFSIFSRRNKVGHMDGFAIYKLARMTSFKILYYYFSF